jgi:hypothetical protein
MHAEDLLVHYCGYRKTVEAVGEGLPKLYIVPPLAYSMNGRGGRCDELRSTECYDTVDGISMLYGQPNHRRQGATRIGLTTNYIFRRI